MLSRFSSPYLWLILATMFWGGNFTVGRALVSHVPPFTMSFIRWSIALIILLPFAWKDLNKTKHVIVRNWRTLFALSLTGIVAFNSLAYISVQYTTSINASLVNALSPVLIMLMSSLVLKERLSKVQFFGVAVSLIGVLWIVTKGSMDYLLSLAFNIGDIIMLFAVFAWAIYSVLMKAAGTDLPRTATFFITILIGIIVLTPLMVWEVFTVHPQFNLGVSQYMSLLYIGIFPSILSFVLWNKALFAIGPSKASIFLNLIVLFASIFSIVFLGEKIHSTQMIGGFLIITGVLLTTNVRLNKGLQTHSELEIK